MIKKLSLSSLLILLVHAGTYAQSDIVATGNSVIHSSGSVSYTVGQAVYSSDSSDAGRATYGVQQVYDIEIIDGIDNKTVSLELIAYPNPTQNNLWLKFSEQFDENIRFVLTDNLGKLIVQEEISSNTTEIPMQELTAGTYHLMVLSNESTIKSFKILKTK